MDKEYIDREYYCNNICRCPGTECDKTKCPIWLAPAADVAPVVHGEWEFISLDGSLWCSRCKRPSGYGRKAENKYCRNCGAKMKEKNNGTA